MTDRPPELCSFISSSFSHHVCFKTAEFTLSVLNFWLLKSSPAPFAEADLISVRSASCFLPCWGRERCWRLGGRKERQESLWKDIWKWGTALVSTVRRDINTTNLRSGRNCHQIGAENVEQSSAEREQGHPDPDGVDQRHNAATSWLLYYPWRHFILYHSRR